MYFQCKGEYPLLCKVWNDNEKEVYFTILIDDSFLGYLDINGNNWENCHHVNEHDVLNPIRMLENNKTYDWLTKEPLPKNDDWR